MDALVGMDLIIFIVTGNTLVLLFPPATDALRFAGAQIAVFMFAWTVLLLWADQRPIERRMVLLFTAIPVIVGLAWANFYAFALGLAIITNLVAMVAIQSVLVIIFLLGYVFAIQLTRLNKL
jgi:glycerol-3-phosphate acyltransferase PlsY